MSEFDALRRLLLAQEQERLDQQQRSLETLAAEQQALPQRLPGLIEELAQGPGRPALERALSPVVGEALGEAVRRDRRAIADLLFPIIGPAIRRAVVDALRNLVQDLNRALEWSVRPRGWLWRIEAWRSGVPFAEVVLKHSLSFRIDHLFLIERESGLLLFRHSAAQLAELDADAIAGMLTAIGDFVRDSVATSSEAEGEGGDDAGLASATVGEHLLQVHSGPVAVLACFVRGTPPASLACAQREALESLHFAAATQADFDWPRAAAPILGELALRGAAATPVPARWPFWLLLALLAALLAWSAQAIWSQAREESRIRAVVAATPGWELLELQRGPPWRLRMLRDPDSEPSSTLAERSASRAGIEVVERPYLSLEDGPQEQRIRRALAAPPGVEVVVSERRLWLAGSADPAWHQKVLQRMRDWPGILGIDDSRLLLLADDRPLAEYHALRQQIEALRVEFAPNASSSATELQAEIGQMLLRAVELGRSLQRQPRFRIVGWSDASGSELRNQRLRADRAELLRNALLAFGIGPEHLLAEAGAGPAQGRFVQIEWLEEAQ